MGQRALPLAGTLGMWRRQRVEDARSVWEWARGGRAEGVVGSEVSGWSS